MATMRNFHRITSGVNIGPLGLALARQPMLWSQFDVRRWVEESTANSVEDIVLRYNKFDPRVEDFCEAVCANLQCECYPAWAVLPEAVEQVNAMMAVVRGIELGRVFISRLRPGGKIPPHSDRIAQVEAEYPNRVPPALYYDRYHLVLSSAPGCQFRAGNEIIEMMPGEFWWFDNQQEHEVVNNSAVDRIHLVVDIHSPQGIYTPPVPKKGASVK